MLRFLATIDANKLQLHLLLQRVNHVCALASTHVSPTIPHTLQAVETPSPILYRRQRQREDDLSPVSVPKRPKSEKRPPEDKKVLYYTYFMLHLLLYVHTYVVCRTLELLDVLCGIIIG